MTDLKFNGDIYNDLINDSGFIDEAEAYLNAFIDDELEKENPDFDFIDACIDAIDSIRNSDQPTEILLSKKDFLNKVSGKKNYKPFIGFVAVAAAATIIWGGMYIGQSEQIKTMVSDLKHHLPFLNQVELTKTRSVVSIRCSFSNEFKDEYIAGENFDSTGIIITADYSDGTKAVIPSDECKFTVSDSFGKAIGYETVTVEYMGLKTDFKVRILFDESSVILNSIYAGFPDDVEIKKENLDKIQVYAVYSDGSERLLNSDKYKITIESVDETTDVVTIDYKNCSATFAIEKEDLQ